jgi:hypothetical protein
MFYMPKNIFIFAPKFKKAPDAANPSGGDATGAFQPGAQKFKSYYEAQGATATSLLFNNSPSVSDNQIFNEIIHPMSANGGQLDTVAYFGHGTKDMLVSARIGPGLLPKFNPALIAHCGMSPTIILYACSCGAPGGIACKISDGLAALQPDVYGHAGPVHAFTNPQVRVFPCGTRAAPDDLVKQWIKAIGKEKGDFWLRFPFMNGEELE